MPNTRSEIRGTFKHVIVKFHDLRTKKGIPDVSREEKKRIRLGILLTGAPGIRRQWRT